MAAVLGAANHEQRIEPAGASATAAATPPNSTVRAVPDPSMGHLVLDRPLEPFRW